MKKTLFAIVMTTMVCACNSNANKADASSANEKSQTEESRGDEPMAVDAEKAIEVSKDIVIKEGSVWNNGCEFFSVRKDGDVFAFIGGTLHEGGCCFGLKPDGKGKYAVVPVRWSVDPEYESEPQLEAVGMYNNKDAKMTAEAKNIDGQDCIIIRHPKKGVVSVLVSNEGLYQTIVKGMAERIAGNYRDQNGKEYSFNSDMTYSIDGKKGKYQFGESYDTPVFVIKLADKTDWGIDYADGKLTLKSVVFDEDYEDYVENHAKTIRLTLMPDESGKWRYPFASERILTNGDVAKYNKEELRVMRNEMWARHGYKFNSPDLQQRFGKVKAYKPVDDNKSVRLSDIEALNAELIQNAEKFSDEDN